MFGYIETNDEHQGGIASAFLRKSIQAAADRRAREASRLQSLMFSCGRLRLVNAVLAYDNWGPCRTDDGEVYFDLMLPYAVEIAHIEPEFDFGRALRRFRYWLPLLVDGMGEAGLKSRWDDQADLRSVARSHNRGESSVGHILHLPTAERIRSDLRITRDLRDSINALYPDRPPIRTVGVIDPPSAAERREADRKRKEAKRRAAGVQPMSSRTRVRDRAVLAREIGCSSRTLSKHDGDPITLMQFLAERGISFQNVSAQYVLENSTGQVLETAEVEEDFGPDDALTILREIVTDPYAADRAWV